MGFTHSKLDTRGFHSSAFSKPTVSPEGDGNGIAVLSAEGWEIDSALLRMGLSESWRDSR